MTGRSGIHQFVPRLEPRDATGNHTLLLQAALRAQGWRSEIFVHEILDVTRHQSLPLEAYADEATGDDVLVYQLSTASPIANFLRFRRGKLVLNYHNLTPPELYAPWDEHIARGLREARRQLNMLAPRAILGIGDSQFNVDELIAAGCGKSEVHPVLFEVGRTGGRTDEAAVTRMQRLRHDGWTQWLFVGRVVPPKAHHRLLMALWIYRQLYDVKTMLHIVGAGAHPSYLQAVLGYADRLGLQDVVHFDDEVSDATLAAYYAEADLFTSLSEHEGFGIPLVEAMAAGLPVVAYGAGAIPETLGDSGLSLGSSEPMALAVAAHRVLCDERLRGNLVRAGRLRSEVFRNRIASGELAGALEALAA